MVSFQWKNPDFLLKNPDFLFRNPDFLLKNVDFYNKTDPEKAGDAAKIAKKFDRKVNKLMSALQVKMLILY